MITGYTSDDLESLHERDSRYAVVIDLPYPLDEVVAKLRRQYDPDYAVIGPHITVVFPFRTPLSLDELTGRIRRAVADFPPFAIELDSIGDFYPNTPVIYWGVRKSGPLDALYKRLYTDLELSLPHKEYCPHVTVAREISNHRVVLVKEKIAPYLSREHFVAERLDLVAPVANRNWVSVRTFRLAGDR